MLCVIQDCSWEPSAHDPFPWWENVGTINITDASFSPLMFHTKNRQIMCNSFLPNISLLLDVLGEKKKKITINANCMITYIHWTFMLVSFAVVYPRIYGDNSFMKNNNNNNKKSTGTDIQFPNHWEWGWNNFQVNKYAEKWRKNPEKILKENFWETFETSKSELLATGTSHFIWPDCSSLRFPEYLCNFI